jgi:polysaccharide biosynthesis transport protein
MIDEDELSSTGSSFTMKDGLAATRKHIHLILTSSAIIFAIGIVIVSLLPNIYSATTTVLVDPQKIPERYVASTIDQNAQLNTLTQQVLSSSRLQEIIERYNLYSNLRTSSREEVIEYMRSKTKIDIKPSLEPEQGLSSFSITYENTDRAIVAVITNQLAASFIAWNLKAREQQAVGTTEFLSSELDEAKKGLEEQEAALQAYRMQHAGATPDALTGNLQALSRLQTESEANDDAISRLDQERILLSQTSSADPRVAPLSERERLVQDKRRLESELSELKRQFTDSYPDVISVKEQIKDMNARLAAIPDSPDTTDHLDSTAKVRLSLIEKELQRHRELKANLQAQIGSFQGKVDSVPILESRLAELTRNYEVSRQNYQSLLDKTLSAGMSEQLEKKQQAARFMILDPAKTPEKPLKPKRLPLFLGIVALSIIVPLGTVLAKEALSGVVKNETQLKDLLPLHISVLGTVPPIQNQFDIRRVRWMTLRTSVFLMLTSVALVIFLLKVRPIL